MSMPNPKRTAVRVQKVRLYPDVEMKQVLDELCDYRQLISHFHQLNSMIRHLSQSPVSELLPQERTFLQSPPAVSPESVRIALQLFCKDAGKQQELLQLLSM